ncbi:hypothetical protein EHM92_00115 [bacterium]|nr:MAG: hypothetical protein EHM92_00115 [bacterium]
MKEIIGGQIGMTYDAVMTKTHMLSLRITEEEFNKFAEIVRRAKTKTLGYAKEVDVLRELIGFKPYRCVAEADRRYLLEGSPNLKKTS